MSVETLSAVSCTVATSSSTRGSGAWRISASIVAEELDCPHEPGRAEALRLLGEPVEAMRRQLHQFGRHQRQEPVAQVADEVLGQRPRVAARRDGVRHHRERSPGVALDHRLDELVEGEVGDAVVARTRHEFERESVSRADPPPLAQHLLDRCIADLEARIGGNPADVLVERVGRQQVELQVLGAAA